MIIRTKILLPMLVVAAGGLGLAGAAMWYGANSTRETASVAESAIRTSELARKASEDFSAALALEKDVMAMTHFVDAKSVKTRFEGLVAAVNAGLAEMKAQAVSPDLAAASEASARGFDAWRRDAAVLLGVASAPRIPMADEESRKAAGAKAALDHALDLAGRDARARIEAIRNQEDAFVRWALGCGLAFAAVALLGAWRVAGRMSRPILELAGSAERLAKGDVSVTFDAVARRDEIGEIARAVAAFRDNVIAAQRSDAAAAEQRQAADAARRHSEQLRASAGQEQTRVVDALSQGLERLAKGDLTYRVEGEFSPSYARLKTDFNKSLDVLQQAMAAISAGARDLQADSSEIAGLAQDLSTRTGSQTASIGGAAAALEDITATVRTTADNAGQARNVVSKTRDEAEKSGALARTAVEAIGRIQQSAREIEKIIGVIDEIAFQTNLLALNAGVEAARAGETGRGFAVVATEVRALAQRSADASKEIKTLISASSAQVKDGVDLVVSAGAALDRIFAQVTEIDNVVRAIAGGAAEQSAGLQGVNRGVSEIDRMNQGNVEVVERTTAACANAAERAAELAEAVAMFNIERPSAASMRRAA